jgi:plastocyanin
MSSHNPSNPSRRGALMYVSGALKQTIDLVKSMPRKPALAIHTGDITIHTARSTAFPQPAAGNGPGPVPLTVAPNQLARMPGMTTISFAGHPGCRPASRFNSCISFEEIIVKNHSLPKSVFAVAFCLVASGATVTASAQSASDSLVTIKNLMFSPMATTIKAGTTITWKNLDAEPHTIVNDAGVFDAGLFHSYALDKDETFTYKFDKPGVYKVFCGIHPDMTETITVQ